MEHGHYGMYNIGAGENTLEVDAWSIPSSTYGEEVHFRTIRLGMEACVPYQRRTIFIAGAESSHPCEWFLCVSLECKIQKYV